MKKHQEELKKLEIDYKKKKDEAISFLLTTLLDVNLSVPDVVVGKFSSKMK